MAFFHVNFEHLTRTIGAAQPFSLADLDLSSAIDTSRYFIPEELTHVFHTEAYHLLQGPDRLRYNQATGLALCEQFIFLEEHILVPVIHGVLRSRHFHLSDGVRIYLHRFIAEEHKHAEMFWRLLEAAAPKLYPTRALRYAQVPWRKTMSLKLLSAFPETFVAWIWMAMLFEERTIDISRRYRAATEIEPAFKRAHYLHMTEETQHVELDRLLVDAVYQHVTPKIRTINARIFRRIMAQYAAPSRIPLAALREVIEHNPQLAAMLPVFRQGLATIRHNPAYQAVFYSRRALPTTFAHLDRFPEMAILAEAMPGYKPPRKRLLATTESTV